MGGKHRLGKYIKLIIYLVIIGLVNVAGATLFFRADLTENNMYSISAASKKVVSTLSEPLTINVFFTKNLPAPYNATERYLRDVLEEYSIYANKYFNYRFYDVSAEAEGVSSGSQSNQELAKNYGIYPVQIQHIEKDEVKFKKAYMGLVLIHGDIIERIATITSTEGLEYKLTTAIKKLNNKISALLALSEKIQVKLFLSSSLNAVAPLMGLDTLNETPKKVEEIVGDLNRKNYGKLDYVFRDPTKDGDHDEISKKYNIMALNWPPLPEQNLEAGKGIVGLVMELGDNKVEMPIIDVVRIPIIGTQYDLADKERLEEMINDGLESLVEINEDLGYLADHGTLGLTPASPMGGQDMDSINRFANLVRQNYTLKRINLKEKSIPESLKCLVIAGPKENFSDYALYQIDQALMRGTNLAVFLDQFKETAPPGQDMRFNQMPTYRPIDTGLEKLLDHYGIRAKHSIVLDENCFKQQVPQQMGGGQKPIYYVPVIKNKFINNEVDFLEHIKGLIAIKVSPLELDDAKLSQNKIKAVKLFSSSEESWEMKDKINFNPMFMTPPSPDQKEQSMVLAYMLEGEFPSYFEGKPMPEKEKSEPESPNPSESDNEETTETKVDISKIEGKEPFLAKSKPARIFLIASSEMLKDTALDEAGQSPNAMFLMNLIDSFNDRSEIASMRSKKQRFNPMVDTTTATKTFVKAFNIAGLPALVVIFGLFVWIRRISRKKRIQTMFADR